MLLSRIGERATDEEEEAAGGIGATAAAATIATAGALLRSCERIDIYKHHGDQDQSKGRSVESRLW